MNYIPLAARIFPVQFFSAVLESSKILDFGGTQNFMTANIALTGLLW